LTRARTAPPVEYLPEVAEADARGAVAAIYDEIRTVLGLPVVNLIYRCLAVEPERLESIWGSLRPNLTARTVEDAAARLVEVARPGRPGPTVAIATAALAADTFALTQATLDAYARGNSRNLLAMHALLDGCSGSNLGGEPAAPATARAILPMPRLEDLDPADLERLLSLSTSLVGDDRPVLVPSLLRHLAARPPLLDVLWRAAADELTRSLAAKSDSVTAEARRLTGMLPFPVPKLDRPAERHIAGRFAVAMSTLLVTGEAFRAALPGEP
jgi:hypothetical protein